MLGDCAWRYIRLRLGFCCMKPVNFVQLCKIMTSRSYPLGSLCWRAQIGCTENEIRGMSGISVGRASLWLIRC